MLMGYLVKVLFVRVGRERQHVGEDFEEKTFRVSFVAVVTFRFGRLKLPLFFFANTLLFATVVDSSLSPDLSLSLSRGTSISSLAPPRTERSDFDVDDDTTARARADARPTWRLLRKSFMNSREAKDD